MTGGIPMRIYGIVITACLAASAACGSKAPSDLKVTSTPTGDVVGKVAKISLAFSRPMVGPELVHKPAVAPPVTFAPDIPGELTWTDDKTLELVPRGELVASTRYVATIPKGTKSLDGNTLEADLPVDFTHDRLTARLHMLGSVDHATPDETTHVWLSQDIALAQVLAHCHYAAGAQTVPAKNGPESPSGPAHEYVLAPSAPLALDTAWTLTCDTELRGPLGNVGFAKPAEQAFHTYGPLKFVKLDPAGKDISPDESVSLSLVFSNPLATPYQMTLVPAVPGFPQNCHANESDAPGLSCAAMLDAQTNYTLTIAPEQVDAFGQKLGTPAVVTFHTADAKPSLSMETGYFIAELKRPVLPLWTRNLKSVDVTAVPITQESFHELRPLLAWDDNKPADFAKTKLVPQAKAIAVAGDRNKWLQHTLGAAELFGGAAGPGMFYLELGSKEVDSDDFKDGGRQKVLVNFTDIGVVSKLSGSRGLVWATRLSTGKPLPGATVTMRDDNGKVTYTGTTDADGIAILPGTAQLTTKAVPGKKPAPRADGLDPAGEHYAQERDGASAGERANTFDDYRIFVQSGADWTMLNPSRSNGLSSWNFNVSVDDDRAPVKLRGFMHTDRGLYRPGETVHVKGLARTSKLAEPLGLPAVGKKVAVTVNGPQGKQLLTTTAQLSPFGGFWFDVALPGDARLGDYDVTAVLDNGTFTRAFTVEEYRPATFEVTGKSTQTALVREGAIKGAIAANYFYGSPVRGGDVAITVHSRARRVAFAGFEDFDFVDHRRFGGYYEPSDESQSLVTEDHVKLDPKGTAELNVPVTVNDVAHDADLLVNASVTAQSNEVETKAFTIPYFAASTYFGVKTAGYFADVGKPQTLQVITVGADGKRTHGPAKVTITRHGWDCVWEDWGYRGNYQCKETETPVLTKAIDIDGSKPAEVVFTPDGGGDYWAVVEGTTEKQQAAPAATELYAYGDGGGSWKSTDSLTLDIVADKPQYKAGDTATLLLKTDLAQASGLVTIERDGVIEKRLITVTPKVKHLQIPITAAYAPNVYVSVALVQGRMGDGTRGKPRMRMGVINLPVRPEDTTLAVAVDTDKPDYRPGEQVTATVKVTDAAGAPVAAEVSIAAADEGVLALMGYQTPNPIPTFYAAWGLGVATATQLEYIRDIPGANQDRPALGGDALGTVRSNFVSTAVWTPGAVTDASGTAVVKFTAPDNLTAFRVMALAADKGHRFGSADKRFTISKPLQLLASLPRFIDIGDVVQGGVVVHNDTGKAGTATVKLVLDKHVTTTGPLERTIDVPKDARIPVLFELAAADVGEGVLQFAVTMDSESDAVELKLPVKQPSPLRVARVAIGIAKGGPAKVAVPMPAHTLPGSAELVISADPDGLAGIDEGLRDLVHYPYGCLEQTTSQVIPMIAARDLAESLSIDGLSGPALDGFVKAGLVKIGRHQDPYGGFSLWPGGTPELYYTAYALWGLSLAKTAGYAVDQTRIDDGLEFLRHGYQVDTARPHYSDFGDRGSQAFALYVRAVLGDKTAQADATTLNTDAASLPIYGKAWLARAIGATMGPKDPAVARLVTELAVLATTAGTSESLIAEPQERSLWAYMSGSARTSAAVLAALVELDPKNPAIPGLVRTVMKYRHTSDYDTQADLYSLLALTAYARTLPSAPASVSITLAGQPVLAGALTGKQRIRAVTVPLAAAGDLIVTPTGEVHYTVQIRYRQTLDAVQPESHGITLTREYLDEAGKPKTSFQVGDLVRVRVTATDKEDADHLMISEPLPAGFEAINTRFVTTGTTGDVPDNRTDWGAYSEMHDDRVDFASEYSSYGPDVHEFMIRAAAAGTFVRPPTVATLMYRPGLSAQTAADTIVIKAK